MVRPRPARASLLLLVVLCAPGALAQDRPGDWTAPLPAEPAAWRASLWLPMGPATEPGVPLGDALGRHAARVRAPTPRAVVVLEALVPGDEEAPALDLARATLTPAGGEPVAAQPGDAWHGQPAGLAVTPPGPDGVVRATVHLPFAPLDPACGDVTLSVPVADGPPLEVRFRRWRDLLAEAEADLAGWKRHVAASRAISAIPPYLDDDGFRRLAAHGDPLLPALVLRELARGEAGDPGALPRFLALHVLAGTPWGRAQQVPGHGDELAAARVLARWRELGHPAVPGISPEDAEGR